MAVEGVSETYIETNGVRLHVVHAGSPTAPLVILLHGYPDFWYGWHHQINFLVQQGYRVWVPDQRGYNLSEKPRGVKAYRLDTLVQDILGLIDASGEQTVYLVGHDWGAAVAWAVALSAPERLKKLVILNVPHLKVFMDTLRSSREQLRKSWYIFFFQIPFLPEFMLTRDNARSTKQALVASAHPATFTDADLDEYVRAWTQPDAMRSMINWYRAVLRYPPTLPENPRIHVPTLIIWGAKDVALTREMAQQSLELCDDGRLVLFDDATHWVQDDKPDEVNALLAEFL